MASPSKPLQVPGQGTLSDEQILRTGRILARLRSRIDQMLDEVEECARVATLVGESDSVSEVELDLVERKMRRILP